MLAARLTRAAFWRYYRVRDNPRRPVAPASGRPLTVAGFQELIRDIYFDKDSRRGIDGTFRWLAEETGELARALRKGDRDNLEEEFADVFAWIASLASLEGIDLARAAAKYADGCPKCHSTPCACVEPAQAAPRRPRGRRPKGGS